MGRASQAMKLLLALLVVAVATAHWTHDDSLAREIGAPPGQEEDADVVALSDELISESETSDDTITYRITIGTAWVPGGNPTQSPFGNQWMWYNGGSSQPLEVMMKGRKGWSAGSNDDQSLLEDGSWKILRYYQGPFMDYSKAGLLAPTLLPGLVPVLTANLLCFGVDDPLDGKRVKDCNAKTWPQEATNILDWCEPNTKTCKAKLGCKETSKDSIDCTGLGYARPPKTELKLGPEANAATMDVGLIQRAQVQYLDVAEILEVQLKSKVVDGCTGAGLSAWACSSPWWPKFIKINTNNAKTGVGNGIYYLHPMTDLHTGITRLINPDGTHSDTSDMYIKAKPGEVPSDVTTSTMVGSHNTELVKCVAQQCEEELDAKNGLTAYEELMAEKREFWG